MFHVYQKDPSTRGLLPPTPIKKQVARHKRLQIFAIYSIRGLLPKVYQGLINPFFFGGISCGCGGSLEALICATHFPVSVLLFGRLTMVVDDPAWQESEATK